MPSWSRVSLTVSIAASSPTFATRNIVSPFIGHPGQVEPEKAAVLLDQLAVRVQPATFAKVADEVCVHARLVLAPRLDVGPSYCEVYRPAEFLVEEYVRARPVNTVVGPDSKFAEVPRPRVGVEQAHQVLLALVRTRLDDLPSLEAKPGAGDFLARDRGWHAEVDGTVGRVLDGTGKHLAARHVAPARGVDKGASLDREGQVRLGTDDADLVRRLEPLL